MGSAAAEAYVGPGAGFALVSSCLVVFVTALIAVVTLLIWPFRWVYRKLRRRGGDKPRIKRFIMVGLDGQDPGLTDKFMKEGKLPNFEKLATAGCYERLATTYPSVSPVAWSSFATGTHPAKHNIFDFLSRDPKTYLPQMSSTEIGTIEKFLKLGKLRIPMHKPELRLLRKSKPFWTLLGEAGIWSTVLRVPITFPPDKFYGAELSAMATPDLLGTQGTFLLYSTRTSDQKFKEGGMRIALKAKGSNGRDGGDGGRDRFSTVVEGPENIFYKDTPPMAISMEIELDRSAKSARVELGGDAHEIKLGELSDWIKLTFKAVVGVKVSGLCRMQVTEMGEHFSLYVTPIALDPEKPAMPVSHPSYYSTYLAKQQGPFSTLGLAEDTWALNEDVVGDETFLTQAYDIDGERQQMFFNALDRLKKGSLVCVFDGTDRIQHMFWRYLEDGHPAARGKENAKHGDAIEKLYIHNDRLVGKVMSKLEKGDLLMVISDHGFTSFRRGINLNTWLQENGYLVLKEGADGSAEWLRDVDWSKTRAYALGLCGMYLNIKGREAQGIVAQSDVAGLKQELIEKMSGLVDPETGDVGINELFDTRALYQGPYLGNAPDFIVGYNHGYRISWDGATGVVAGPVWDDNAKAWSGDHGVDPRIVPGVFFCNNKIDAIDPAIIDIAPSVLRLFGQKVPDHIDGKLLFLEDNPLSGSEI
ncbi:MAG: alkaline phosphatase family protein [Acidobacteria bacterium]|nr:alkaline phosphatase family protein [Acidobacteriota bacterium]